MSEASENSDSSFIGPVLPPELLKRRKDSESSNQNEFYGPALPPGLMRSQEPVPSDDGSTSCSNSSTSSSHSNSKAAIGPQLPDGFQVQHSDSSEDEDEEEEEDEVIGPQPYTGGEDLHMSRVKSEVEARAERMKVQLCGPKEERPAEREEWMTSPPTQLKKAFGLGPRTFNARNAPVDTDNSLWTSVPGKPSQSKPKEKANDDEAVDTTREEVFAKYVDDVKKSKSESLMDIHQKNLKRKLEKNPAPQERRPFDRNVDLDATRLDNAQRDAIVKRSRQLNDRFSAGKSKFL